MEDANVDIPGFFVESPYPGDYGVSFDVRCSPEDLPSFFNTIFGLAGVHTNLLGKDVTDTLYVAIFSILKAMREAGVLYRPPLAEKYRLDSQSAMEKFPEWRAIMLKHGISN